MKTAIILDSGSYYYVDSLNEKGIFAVPLQIINGNDTYMESLEISIEDVNKLLFEKNVLKTSLPSLGMIEDLFNNIRKDGYDSVLVIPITSGISGTLNAMRTASEFVGLKFNSIDCFTTAWIPQIIALDARKKLNEGMDIEDVIASYDEMINKSDTFIIADDLSHLSRSGRLSPVAAALGGFLKIKPILHLNKSTNGVIDAFSKVRTMNKAIDTLIDHMKEQGVGDGYFIGIADVGAPGLRELTVNKIKSAFPTAEIVENQLISTVSVHIGIGSVAFQYAKLP